MLIPPNRGLKPPQLSGKLAYLVGFWANIAPIHNTDVLQYDVEFQINFPQIENNDMICKRTGKEI